MVAARVRGSFGILVAVAYMSGCTNADESAQTPGVTYASIVGGQPVDVTAAPWQVSLQDGGHHFCGGSIIAPEWVVTAQHCVASSVAAMLNVVAGVTRLSQAGQGQTRGVAEIVRFPGFRSPVEGKDIALLRLSAPLDLSTPQARAIPLVTRALADAGVTAPSVMTFTSGWGFTREGGASPDELQQVDVPLVSQEDASAAYAPTVITPDQLAAGYLGVGQKDACQGDSGGPLVVPAPGGAGFLLAGIVSWGTGCAAPKYPGMYARVSAFDEWVTERMSSSIAVRFTCREGTTLPGQSVYVVGGAAALGAWNPAHAVRLTPQPYPHWSATVTLPPGKAIEWKCLKRDERRPNERLEWQPGENNVFQTPAEGSTEVTASFST